VVEALFNEESNDAVGVEDEVCSFGVLISDHSNRESARQSQKQPHVTPCNPRQKSNELGRLRQCVHILKWDLRGNCSCRLLLLWTVIRTHTLLGRLRAILGSHHMGRTWFIFDEETLIEALCSSDAHDLTAQVAG
jgi:hypothetical protein